MKHSIVFFKSICLAFAFIMFSASSYATEKPKLESSDSEKIYGYDINEKWIASPVNPPGKEMTIDELYNKIFEDGKIVEGFSEDDVERLPLGLIRSGKGTANQVVVLIVKGRTTSVSTSVDVFVQVPFAPTGDILYFVGENIQVSKGGFGGGAGLSRLYLAEIVDKSGNSNPKFKLRLDPGKDKTYIEWGCQGFENFKLSGYFEFPKDKLTVDRDIEKKYPHKNVRAEFSVEGKDFSNMLAEVSFPAFKVKGIEDFTFKIEKATMDMSETTNPDGIGAQPLYSETINQLGPFWTGFYAKQAKIILPKFLRTDSTAMSELAIEGIILDQEGFTGNVSLQNVLSINEGQAGGWPLSINDLFLDIHQNKLVGGGMGGAIVLPFSKNESQLAYEALIYKDEKEVVNYSFEIATTEEIEASALLATIRLAPSSRIKLIKKDGELYADAMLHGSLSISQSKKVEIPDIAFENFNIISKAPYVKSGNFALTSAGNGPVAAAKIGPFKFSLDDLGFRFYEGKYSIDIDGGITLMGKEGNDNIFSGKTGIRIDGVIEKSTEGDTQGQQRWVVKRSKIKKLEIEANIGVLKMKGGAEFFGKGDEFGSGFQGKVNVALAGTLEIDATVMFAAKDDINYWYVDAVYGNDGETKKPKLGTGAIKRLAGGFAYNMQPTNRNELQNNIYTYQQIQNANDQIREINEQRKLQNASASEADKQELLTTNDWVPTDSGLKYEMIPGGGISAFMDIVMIPKESTKSALIAGSLSVILNSNFGLRYIEIGGTVHLMPKLDGEGRPTSKVKGEALVSYDFENKELHAEFGATFGSDKIASVNIFTVLHFGNNNWWVYLGTPNKRMNATIDKLGTATAYFMVGTKLEPFPAPQISLQDDWGNSMGGDFTRGGVNVETGGIAFGAALYKELFDEEFFIFYANFNLSLGFDIAFQDLRGRSCEGHSGEVGINGWYASGQAWAAVTGSVGIDVKLKFIKKKIKIFSVAAGIVLTADLPNPTWMQGYVFGKFSVLGGLVKGQVSFKATIGEKCVIAGAAPGMDVNIVKQITPDEGDAKVSVFNVPQVLFELPIGKTIPVSDGESTKKYKIAFDYFKVLHNNIEIEGKLKWNDEKDLVAFSPKDVLPSETTVKIKVKAHWQEYKNGSYVNLTSNGQLAEEVKELSFVTDKAPDYIDPTNVVYSYPQNGQYNYYQNEHPHGYIKLNQAQSYLWRGKQNSQQVNYEVFFNEMPMGDTIKVALKADTINARLSFDMPTGLSKEKAYRLSVWRVVKNQELALNNNVATTTKDISTNDRATITKVEKSIVGGLTNAISKDLYDSYFRVSRYNTFTEKMAQIPSTKVVMYDSVNFNVANRLIGLKLELEETLDGFELNDTEHAAQMVEINSVPFDQITSDNWVRRELFPQIYENHPYKYESHTFRIKRDISEHGLIPLKKFRNQYYKQELKTDVQDLMNGNVSTEALNNYFWYDVSYYSYQDYKELENQMAAVIRGGYYPPSIKSIHIDTYKPIKLGTYNLEFNYRPPGMSAPTSKSIIQLDWKSINSNDEVKN